MLRKVLYGILLTALTVLLVGGAIYRTSVRWQLEADRAPAAPTLTNHEVLRGNEAQEQNNGQTEANNGAQHVETQRRGWNESADAGAIAGGLPERNQGRNQNADEAGSAEPHNSSANATVFEATVLQIDHNQVTIATNEGVIAAANLGPTWYWSEHGITLAVGDAVTCAGVIVDSTAELNWIESSNGSARYELRDANGVPLWRR